ncbi:cell envelope biogenesis protein TolA [Dickeya parazeae]|uniref:cell envelope biogenesis protein TolA n=1 Tax=Dickeya parazeae TaxID=2893572 RepID=UPI001AEC8118|nr:cell envelope biogenesis protein TolA [Dickeya parazeae]MBP2837108.1 cell envelope biogenesis protein TolA [Dickeya parazeae]
MTSPLSFNRSATGTAAQNIRTDSDASTAQTSTETETSREQPSLASVMVQFSDEVRKRIDATMRARMSKLNNADQDLARGRIEQIKRRIQMLKMMLLSLAGQSVPPGVLRELRQLAAELGQAAKTLSAGSGGAATDTAGGENQSSVAAESGGAAALSAATATSSTSSTSTAGDSASVESEALGEHAAGTSSAAKSGEGDASAQEAKQWQDVAAAFIERSAGSTQHRADAKSVQDAVRELKSLLAMVKNASRHDDKEAQKQMRAINQSIADIEKTVQSMSMTGGGADVSADLSVGPAGNVSIDVQV